MNTATTKSTGAKALYLELITRLGRSILLELSTPEINSLRSQLYRIRTTHEHDHLYLIRIEPKEAGQWAIGLYLKSERKAPSGRAPKVFTFKEA